MNKPKIFLQRAGYWTYIISTNNSLNKSAYEYCAKMNSNLRIKFPTFVFYDKNEQMIPPSL